LSSRAESCDADFSRSFAIPQSLSDWEELLTVKSGFSEIGVALLSADFRFRAVNDCIAQMNGIAAEAHPGRSVRDVLGVLSELFESQLARVISTGNAVLHHEFSALLPGRARIGEWIGHYFPIKDSTSQIGLIGVILVETAQEKKLEKSLHAVSATLESEKKRVRVMTEVARLLSAKWDTNLVFPRLSTYLRRALRQEYASLSLRDQQSGKLVRKAIDFPLRMRSIPPADFGGPDDPGGKALQTRAPVVLDREEMKDFQSGTTDHLLTEGLKSLCCVPLIRPRATLGVLVLGSTRAQAFKSEDLTLLEQVAAQLAIALENAETAREIECLKHRLSQERRHLEGKTPTHDHFEGVIGNSPEFQAVIDQVMIVAETNATVLLLGETGTGKDLIAHAIHRASKRRERALVSLNCAAIPTGLLESELFGHERGAFTGAVRQKTGRLEMADGGTLFLDEIGDIPLELQPKLLRVLQDHEFERVGGNRTIRVNLRLIAATNRDLAKSVASKDFRSDLFYRLNIFPVCVPPLRQRREDIPDLVRYFVHKFAARMQHAIETIPSETMDALMNWNWPGNVRELENLIERSVILTEGTALRVPLYELTGPAANSEETSLQNVEREYIIQKLRETRGLISGPKGAARLLGVKRTTLQSKIERLGITRQDYSEQGPL
jgi:formate hydrogenlyase transcriptional activator